MLQIVPQSEFADFKVPAHEVWRYLGYIEESKAHPEVRKIFKRVIEEVGPSLLEPVACYDIFSVDKVTPSTVEVDGVSFDSPDLALRQGDAKEVAIFIMTVGSRVGEEAEKLITGGDSVLGYMLDVYASAAVDTMAYKVRDIIEGKVRSRGYQAINHGICLGKECPAYRDCGGILIKVWSPGYGDWSVLENKKIFSIVDANQIGVRVKESGMMEPRKSYVCAVPLGPGGEKSPQKCVEWEREWTQRGIKSR